MTKSRIPVNHLVRRQSINAKIQFVFAKRETTRIQSQLTGKNRHWLDLTRVGGEFSGKENRELQDHSKRDSRYPLLLPLHKNHRRKMNPKKIIWNGIKIKASNHKGGGSGKSRPFKSQSQGQMTELRTSKKQTIAVTEREREWSSTCMWWWTDDDAIG